MKSDPDGRTKHPEPAPQAPEEDRPFRLGRLMLWLLGVVIGLALIAALVDILVLGW